MSSNVKAPLQVERTNGVLTLTLDRPEKGNALSPTLVEALLSEVTQANANAGGDLHSLVLCGQGANFCTGFDLSDLDSVSDGDLLLRFVRIETLLAELWHSPLRTVALAQGRAWGAGADLVAVCELRLARPEASFRFPGAGFGLVLGTRRLAERVGPDLARDWVTHGLEVGATAALQAGLVSVIDGADAALSSRLVSPAVDGRTASALRRATRIDGRDADLAALVRSAAEPGLVQRIAAYRARRPGRAAETRAPTDAMSQSHGGSV
jgi:enoyl-CoA hydratase